jgi:hypothetical protein
MSNTVTNPTVCRCEAALSELKKEHAKCGTVQSGDGHDMIRWSEHVKGVRHVTDERDFYKKACQYQCAPELYL